MDLFVLDKLVLVVIKGINAENFFKIALGAMIGTYLWIGTYKSNRKVKR
jgi:hypothetical protein